VSVIGDYLSGSGTSSADQKARNKADADASNKNHTDQVANVDQKLPDSRCGGGCGGKGQEQNLVQTSKTKQDGRGNAKAKQNLVNVDLPFVLSLGKEKRGRAKAE
jgi:hypothetical protein